MNTENTPNTAQLRRKIIAMVMSLRNRNIGMSLACHRHVIGMSQRYIEVGNVVDQHEGNWKCHTCRYIRLTYYSKHNGHYSNETDTNNIPYFISI